MNAPQDKLVFDSAYDVAEWVSRQIHHAMANADTNTKLSEAHDYTNKYCMPDGWGRNVWHTVLDDAIKLRKEKEKL